MRKCVLWHMRTTKVQISLRIRIALSKGFNILARFCRWAGWFECYLVENTRSHVFAWCGSHDLWPWKIKWKLQWEPQSETAAKPWHKEEQQMSPVKRICVFEHSVITNFNCACPAIQRGQRSGFLSEGSSWLTAFISEQRRFWRDCADAQARLNLRCSHKQ